MIHGGDIYSYNRILLDFSSNINPLGIPETVKDIITENLNLLSFYPDLSYKDLREKLALYFNVDPFFIVPGNGAVELIFLLMRFFKNRRAIIPVPSFLEYQRAAQLFGMDIQFVYFKDLGEQIVLDLSSLEILKRNGVLIVGHPNNPTGLCVDDMHKLVELCRRKNWFLVVDESFLDFTNKRSFLDFMDIYPDIAVIKSITKFFALPGLRFGFVICKNEKVVKGLWNLKEPWSVNSLADIVARKVYSDSMYIERTKKWLEEERSFFTEELRSLKELRVYKTEVNFVLVGLNGLTAGELKEKMIDKGILIRDASNFKGLDNTFIRLAIKDRISNTLCIKALKECLEGVG